MRLLIIKYIIRNHLLYWLRFCLILQKPSPLLFKKEAYNNYNDKKDIPPIFTEENQRIQPISGTTLECVLKIGIFIKENYKGGRNIGLSSAETLQKMKRSEGGVCGDYSQIFINFCILNDIKVREWGVHDKIYQNRVGHVFNEVYIEELEKWVCIDVSRGIYFISTSTNTLLSATEMIDIIAGNLHEDVVPFSYLPQIVKIGNENLEAINKIFFNPCNIFFLITHYKIKKIDTALKKRMSLPIPLVHMLLIFKRQYYHYLIYVNRKNKDVINDKLKWAFRKYEANPTIAA